MLPQRIRNWRRRRLRDRVLVDVHAASHYALPGHVKVAESLRGDDIGASLSLRSVGGEVMRVRSSVAVDPSVYEQFYMLRAYRSEVVARHVSRFLHKAARAMRDELAKLHPNMGAAYLDRCVTEFACGDRWSTDAVFGDLFRLFFQEAEYTRFSSSGTRVRRFMRDAYTSSMFASMRAVTRGNPAMSAFAAVALMEADGDGDGLGGGIGRAMAQEAASGGDSSEQTQDKDDSDSGGSDGDEIVRAGSGGGDAEAPPQEQQGVEHAVEQAARAVRERAEEARGDSYAAYGQFAGVGYHDPETSLRNLDYAERLTESVLEGGEDRGVSVERLMRVFGRLEGEVTQAITEARLGDGEVVDVVQGPWLDRMTASEYSALASDDEVVSMLFDVRFAEGSLQTMQREGLDDSASGPVIMFVDCSGSMATMLSFVLDDGRTESAPLVSIAGAFGLYFVRHARRVRRRILVYPFNDGAVVARRAEFDFQRESYSHLEVRDRIERCLALEASGGTSFVRALEQAMRDLRSDAELRRRYTRADVVFISDGEGGVDGGSQREARGLVEAGARLFGFFVLGTEGWCARVCERNAALFDACDASTPSEVVPAMARFYARVLRMTDYERSARG